MCKCSIIQFISIFYIMCGYVLIQTLPDMQETMFTHISGVADRNWHTKYIFTRSANLRSLCSHWEYPLEKEMVIHSSILAWKIPWMEETGRLQSNEWQRVGYNWATSLSFFLPSTLHSLHCCLFTLSNLGRHSLKLPRQGKKIYNLRCSRTVPPSSTWQQEQQGRLTIKKNRNSLHLRAKCSCIGCPTCSSLDQYWCSLP